MSWTSGLNPHQIQAVNHNFGPLLILAGAGSGKTTVLVARTGRLIDEGHAKAKQVCVLTFTNKAARELKHRVAAKLGPVAKDVWAGTFHSFGLQVLKTFHKEARLPKGFGILDSGDSQSLVKELLKDHQMFDKADFDAGRLLSQMSSQRAQPRDVNPDDAYGVAAHWLLPKYLKRLRKMGAVDFDELLFRPLELFRNFPEVKARVQGAFTQVMVDEFQDTNAIQMKLVRVLSETHQNISVVGDDDQSIYGWRGACIDNILSFPHAYENCKVIRLEDNYRSSPSILSLANAVIAKNEKRHQKILRPQGSKTRDQLPELFVYETEDEEIERVVDEMENQHRSGRSWAEMAVLYRSNGQGAVMEAELKKRQIPHRVSGGTSFFERKEIKDILAYLRCSFSPNEISFRRILNTPSRGIGEASISLLEKYALESNISFFRASLHWREAGVQDSAGHALDQLHGTLKGLIPLLLDPSKGDSACKRLLGFCEDIGYRNYLTKYSKDAPQAHARFRILEILGNILDKYVAKGGLSLKTIKDFVSGMELREDEGDDEPQDQVQLLTLHACKGLEFPSVFLLGVEEDILPHKTLGTDSSEERRLFYVGITRAKEHLIMTRARQRRWYGKMRTSAPSRFLLELPKGLIKEYESGARPVSADERKAMLAELYKKLEQPETLL